ncbi:MAG: hypothetical protein WC783_00795 [Candidatus Paceibacterota bacterium]|jgi:hypothetical protein
MEICIEINIQALLDEFENDVELSPGDKERCMRFLSGARGNALMKRIKSTLKDRIESDISLAWVDMLNNNFKG